jgi:hypothetical protein
MAVDTFDIPCSGCPRSFSMTLITLSTRKTCTFCGAPLTIPEAVKNQLATHVAARSPVGQNARKSAVSCPVCARQTFVDGFQKSFACQYCTCPFTVVDGKAVAAAPVLTISPGAARGVLDLACANCRLKKLAVTENAPAEARCQGCGTVCDLYALPLEALISVPQPGAASALVELGRQAILTRWQRREVGLGEAVKLLADFALIDAALNTASDVLTPVSPSVAADVIQYAVLGVSTATRQEDFDRVTLTISMRRDSGIKNNVDIGSTILFNAVGLSLLAVTGRGFVGYSQKKDELEADPALILELAATPGGTLLYVATRNAEGFISRADRGTTRKVFDQLRTGLPDGLRRFYAFKALFGHWTTGAMFYGTPANSIRARLENLGGALASQSEALSQALVPPKK